MLQLFDGNRVQLLDPVKQVMVLLEVERAGSGFALQMGVVHQNRWKVSQDLWQPIGRNLLTKQQHRRFKSCRSEARWSNQDLWRGGGRRACWGPSRRALPASRPPPV